MLRIRVSHISVLQHSHPTVAPVIMKPEHTAKTLKDNVQHVARESIWFFKNQLISYGLNGFRYQCRVSRLFYYNESCALGFTQLICRVRTMAI